MEKNITTKVHVILYMATMTRHLSLSRPGVYLYTEIQKFIFILFYKILNIQITTSNIKLTKSASFIIYPVKKYKYNNELLANHVHNLSGVPYSLICHVHPYFKLEIPQK